MIPDNVTLVVKAPNQQIEDQNIECQSSWTVKQLKGHLSDVYPSKPTADEQKIIYSGQLLDDSAVLKDVLRTYETQLTHFTHTMHLVCTPRRARDARPPAAVTTDGVRRRNVETPPAETVTRPETRQNDQNHTAETIQRYFQSAATRGAPPPNFVGVGAPPANFAGVGGALPMAPDAASMHNHVLMMQQAYMQYMQQYAQMLQAGGNAPAAQPMNVVNEAPQQPPAEAPPAEEPEDARRDWLDQLYAISRLVVLVSLVHLYSSFYRLVVVLLLCIFAYLHQTGYLRDLGLGANQNQPAAADAAPAPARDPPQANANEANEANAHEANAQEPNAAPPPATPPPNDDQQSLLAATWMIFSSFFASLIPEVYQ